MFPAVLSPFLTAPQGFWETESFWKESTRLTSEQIQRAQAYRADPDLVRRALLDPFFGPANDNEAVYPNSLICEFEGPILSNDTALEPHNPIFTGMVSDLEHIFQTHQREGTVTIEHDTRVVYEQQS